MYNVVPIITVVTLTLVTGVFATIPKYTPTCKHGVLPRREWRTLTPNQQRVYLDTVRKVQQRPAPNKPSTLDRLSKLHDDLAKPGKSYNIHSTPLFFPFHRLLLHYLELELQRFVPTLTIPWWSVSYDSQSPELSPIWDETTFGTNGDADNDYCVTDGVFKNYRPFYPKDHCLRRNWTTEDTIGAFHSTEMINKILTTATTYETFRRGIEFTPHGVVHTNIGGDMTTMLSPNEPVFWLHHSNVDKWWSDWQHLNSTNFWAYDGKHLNGTTVKLVDFLPGAKGIRVGDMYDTRKLCYTYVDMKLKDVKKPTLVQQIPTLPHAKTSQDTVFHARRLVRRSVSVELDMDQEMNAWRHLMDTLNADSMPLQPIHSAHVSIASAKSKDVKLYKPPKNGALVKPTDRSNLLALRIPSPLPDSWLKMNGLPVASVRAQELAVANVTQDLNALTAKGYVSPSALWNQQDKVVKLVDKVDSFVADVNGTRVVVNVTQSNQGESIDKAQQVVNSIRHNAPSGQVQTPIDKIAANLTDIIGPPVSKEQDAASNPFSPRKVGENGFSNKDSEKLLNKVEENKEKQRENGSLTPKKEKEDAIKDKKLDLALGGGGAKSTTVSSKSFHTPDISPVWIPSYEWQG